MSGGHRHGAKEPRGRSEKRSKDVSLADRLGSGGTPSVLPGGSQAAPARQSLTRKQLREQRESQQRAAKQRWLVTGLAVVAVVVVGALLVLWLSGGEDDDAAPTDPGRTERTLTVTLAPDNEAATSGALMVYDVDNTSAGSVLIQSRLFVEGPTPEGIPFGETVLLGDDAAPGTSLADTLDVVVDDTWQVSDAMLAQLVDIAQGVLVDVDVDVIDGQSIVVPAGDGQLLDGRQAVAFATYLGPDEVEEARLARFGQVLDQVIQRLPAERDALVAALQEVKATERSTLDVESLADFALGYGDIGRDGDTSYQSLPVDTLETGGPKPSLVVNLEGLERLHQGLLADSLPPDAGGDQISVYVQNGVGTPGLVEQDAATLLRDAGYDFINGGNATTLERPETLVLIPDGGEASRSLGADVAATLGVPDTAVQVSDQGSSIADVIVILGEDFQP
jgi:hypothetical protein